MTLAYGKTQRETGEGIEAPPAPARISDSSRVAFVDYGKGMCIILVVMMHSTLGVGIAMNGEGWMHLAVEFSKPFRMPDFFLISGLFLARTIDAPWSRYADRKIVHFAYFYVLWALIQIVLKDDGLANGSIGEAGKAIALAIVEPPSTLWFIYILPIFFVVTRLTRNVPWPVIMAAGVIMESARIAGAGIVIGEFASRFIYFYAGYRFAPQIFAFARGVSLRSQLALAGLGLWALVNISAVFYVSYGSKPLAELQGFSLVFGFAGALALLAAASLMARYNLFGILRWLGERSLVIYLAFFLFMAASRIALVQSGLIGDIGLVSLLVTIAGVAGPLVLAAAVKPTPLKYLFERPAWARLKSAG